MKRLYLHVGTPKTGTTSIQHFLYNNRELLEAQGYLYPVIGCFFHQLSKSQSRLAFACKKKRSKLLPPTLKLSLPDCIQDLHGCLRRSTAENVIISSEIFWGELNTEDIHRIRVALSPLFQSIQIIIYLRPQDEYLEASYNQFVKMGLTRVPFDQFVSQRLQSADLSLRYYHAVQAFWQVFGRENVLVRRYSPNHLEAMNVIEDLTTIIGCVSAKPFKTHGRLNESLPIELLTVLREFHIRYCRNHQDFLSTRKVLLDMSAMFDNSRYGLFSTEQRKILMNHFETGNLALAKQIGLENGLFDLCDRRTPPQFVGVKESVRGEAARRVETVLGKTNL